MNLFKKIFKNKRASELTEKIMITGFSVAAAAAVILFMTNVIIEHKTINGSGILETDEQRRNRIIPESEGTDGISYSLEGSYYTVSGYSGTEENVVVPSYHNDTPVKKIGERAFCYNGNVLIKSVSVGYGVETIDTYSFMGGTTSRQINGVYQPFDVGPEVVSLPDSVTTINCYAFWSSYNLKSVNIPAGVTTLKQGTFGFCTSLTSLTIPETVISIEGTETFAGCAFESISLPSGITVINPYVFRYCTALKNITIGPNIKSIKYDAFQGCTGLTEIYLPSTVQTIEGNAFENCSNLTIKCQPSSKPNGWYNGWNSGRPVIWGV